MLVWLFGSLAVVALAILVAGFVLGAKQRGETSTREGPEVYAEMVQRNSSRESRREGQSVLKQKTWVGGTGKSGQVTVTYTSKEIAEAWRQSNLKSVAPGLMIAGGLLGVFLFGGLTLVSLGGILVLVGVGLVLMGGYGFWQFLRGASR
ncbi:MAG: hypothetical protein QNJ40_23275 [Xanthomonadales bacterium]|nr:hypothetical protein [Xanthomonadales bacterium]